jgi:hypothetical protein
MLKVFRCDLHIHTCLSPCAELDLYPSALVEKVLQENIDIIAVCDHNASENVPYVMQRALGTSLTVLPGMEVTSREEVHVLALFNTLDTLKRLQAIVYDHLIGSNREEVFGCQAIVNENDEVEGFNDRLLIGATGIPLEELITRIHALGGLAVASHIDREAFSVLGQLGFIDPSLAFDALEVTFRTGIRNARLKYPDLADYAIVTSSDAHFLTDIGRGVTRVMMAEPTTAEIKLAFQRLDGRRILE